jgi:cephalosporin hydroxylase
MNHSNTQTTRETGHFVFCPTLMEVILNRRLQGRTGKSFSGLGALSSVNNMIVLRNLCLELKPRRTLEIGLSFGGSCLVFTASHRDLGHAPQRQHVALDPFQATVWDDAGLLLAEQAGLSSYLDFRPQFSSLELPSLIREGRKFDLVYVDGSHIFEDVFVDAHFVGRLLSDGGVMVFDDSSLAHIKKVLRFIRRTLGSAFVELDISPYRGDSGKNAKYLAARLLGRTQMTAFRRVGKAEREWSARFVDF